MSNTISDLQDDDDGGYVPYGGGASTGGYGGSTLEQYTAPAGGAADTYGFGGYEPPPPVSYGYDGPPAGQSGQVCSFPLAAPAEHPFLPRPRFAAHSC